METNPTSTTTDTKDQTSTASLTSAEKKTITNPAVELDELDDELLEEVAGGVAIYSPACVPNPS